MESNNTATLMMNWTSTEGPANWTNTGYLINGTTGEAPTLSPEELHILKQMENYNRMAKNIWKIFSPILLGKLII